MPDSSRTGDGGPGASFNFQPRNAEDIFAEVRCFQSNPLSPFVQNLPTHVLITGINALQFFGSTGTGSFFSSSGPGSAFFSSSASGPDFMGMGGMPGMGGPRPRAKAGIVQHKVPCSLEDLYRGVWAKCHL